MIQAEPSIEARTLQCGRFEPGRSGVGSVLSVAQALGGLQTLSERVFSEVQDARVE